MCVLGYDVSIQIAGQQQWVAAGQSSQLWWSPKVGDDPVFSTGYGLPAHAGEPFPPTKAVVSKSSEVVTILGIRDKIGSNKEACSMAQQMLKTGEVQDVLQQPREVADIGGLGHPTVAKRTWCSSGQEMLKAGELQTVHSPDAEKRGSP